MLAKAARRAHFPSHNFYLFRFYFGICNQVNSKTLVTLFSQPRVPRRVKIKGIHFNERFQVFLDAETQWRILAGLFGFLRKMFLPSIEALNRKGGGSTSWDAKNSGFGGSG